MTADVAARIAAGTVELAWSRRVAASDSRVDRLVVVGATLLGVRDLTQAALVARRQGRTVRRLGAVVDLLHASSMLLAGQHWPSRRRVCWTSAGMATALAATSWYAAQVDV